MRIIILVILLSVFTGSVFAQSVLEHSVLSTAAGAAGVAAGKDDEKGSQGEEGNAQQGMGVAGKAMTDLYGEGATAALSRGGVLMQQVGGGFGMFGMGSPQQEIGSTEDSVEQYVPQETVGEAKSESSPAVEESKTVKVFLRDGKTVEGNLVEKTDEHIKLDILGVAVTYFNEEIERIEQ